MARLGDLVFDCARPAATARFWAAALDGYAVAPYDDAELARLRSLGITSTEDDPTVLVEPAGPGPRLWFQLVPEAKTVKNRLHPDLFAADLQAEARRLTALGATVHGSHPDHLVLTDPEGNEFCVFPVPDAVHRGTAPWGVSSNDHGWLDHGVVTSRQELSPHS